jgi:ribosomal protein S18 acetylase RimI-like enzyme
MPEIEIRPAVEKDIPALVRLDHSYTSDYVWQMDLQVDEGQVTALFREIRLPRSVRVDYPRLPNDLAEDWQNRSALLVAALAGEPVGYTSLKENLTPRSTWMTDLVVAPRLRRQGIGSALTLAAQEWVARHSVSRRLVLEMQPKNFPAISLSQKLGFDFSGYNDHYYANRDVAIFFAKWLG